MYSEIHSIWYHKNTKLLICRNKNPEYSSISVVKHLQFIIESLLFLLKT